MKKFAKSIVKHRVMILLTMVLLLIPSIFGMVNTRINYDMLDYLPSDMDTVIGQEVLLDDFGKGAFSFVIVEDMEDQEVSKLIDKMKQVDHVESIIWYDTIFDPSIPKQLLPSNFYDAFNTENSTMMAVFFDSATSDDETMDAIHEIKAITNKQCYVSGMSALVTDLKDLCEKEEPIYVCLAVVCATIIMMVCMDSYLIPFIFLFSIGVMILLNMGTNYFFGEISYITKALSAVLQLAVTMDYSIFLWHSYNEQLTIYEDHKEAMVEAIHKTFTSVVGSSITTVAGFIALCFMSFTLGKDLGIVMAKGVILGVIGCVTLLPATILVFDKALQKSKHRPLLHGLSSFGKKIVSHAPIYLGIFVLLLGPAFYGYQKTNDEVYYDMGQCLPTNIDFVKANKKLIDDYHIASSHMVLVSAEKSPSTVRAMMKEMEAVDGVEYVLGLESLVGENIPEEMIPTEVKAKLHSENWKLLLVNSKYPVASDEVNAQVTNLNQILKSYDHKGMLIGEAPCMKDMIETTDHDFKVVNAISILAIFIIIAFVEKSITLPIILISVIELAIFINLGLPHYLHQSLPFIAPICISTIQLGATVDYAILMTTRYKQERIDGHKKKEAIKIALETSIDSIIVSGLGLFAATFGVAIYSDIDIIRSMCMLMARGAIISMFLVIFILPALFTLFDKIICASSARMRQIKN